MIPQKVWVASLAPRRFSPSLRRDESLEEKGLRLPKSTRTIHRLLRENGRIASRLPTFTDPIERPPPMRASAA